MCSSSLEMTSSGCTLFCLSIFTPNWQCLIREREREHALLLLLLFLMGEERERVKLEGGGGGERGGWL